MTEKELGKGTVLVTGASGTLGTAVLPRLAKDGYAVRPMSRRARPGWVAADLRTGEGLTDAVRGVETIVHLASAPGRPAKTDIAGTKLLLAAAKEAGVRHVVYVSIVGVDRVPWGYYRAKLATERVVEASGVPYTILRATQFHEFAETLLTMFSKLGPVIIDPKWVLQPVAIEDVADRIANLLTEPASGESAAAGEVVASGGPAAVGEVVASGGPAASGEVGASGGPAASGEAVASGGPVPSGEVAASGGTTASGRVIELGGPRVLSADEMIRGWLAARGSRRPVWKVGLPGAMSRAIRAGGLITEATPTGAREWQDYLATKY